MTRLETMSPELAGELRRAEAAKQRAACLVAADFAVSHARIQHPLVEKALEKVRAAGVLSPEEKAELDALAAQLDEGYFALQEAAEADGASPEDYVRMFGQARAVAALTFAGGEDAFQAAAEGIYEAAATTDDKEELFALIQSVLE